MRKTIIYLFILTIYFSTVSSGDPSNDLKIRERKDKIYKRVSLNSEVVISILSTEQVGSILNNYAIVYHKSNKGETIEKISIGKCNRLRVKNEKLIGILSILGPNITLDSLNSYCCELLDNGYMGSRYEDYFEVKIKINETEKKFLIYKQHLRENRPDLKGLSEIIAVLMPEPAVR